MTPLPPTSADATTPSRSAARARPPATPVDAALLELAYSRVPQTQTMTVAVVLVFIGLFRPYFSWATLSAWAAVMLLVSTLRLLDWWLRRRGGPLRAQDPRWYWTMLAGALASGAAWSSTLRAKAMTLAPRTGL